MKCDVIASGIVNAAKQVSNVMPFKNRVFLPATLLVLSLLAVLDYGFVWTYLIVQPY